MNRNSRNEALSHEAAWELLPWLVNGSLSGSERARVDAHVRDCLTCRREFQAQQNLSRLVRQSPEIMVSAQRGYQDLMSRVEAEDKQAMRPTWIAQLSQSIGRWLLAPRMVVAATCGLAGVVVGFILLAPEPSTDPTHAPEYGTLTRDNGSDNSLISVVFSGQATEKDILSLVDEVDGRILTGPTPAGVYVVRLEGRDISEVQLRETIQRLADDQRVQSVARTRLQTGSP